MRFRRLIAVLALAVALPAAGQTKFVFSPQWMAQAQFAGFYVAKDMGFYDEEGLDVEIRHPFSTQTLENRVREGESQAFSMSLSQAMDLVDKGIPLVNILQTSMNSSLVIVSRYGADPLTLRNAKVLTWRAGLGQIPKSVAARENLDYRWITASSSLNLFVAGAVDATLATTYNEYYQLLQTGLITPGKGIYRFSEHGYNIQEDGVYMTAAAYRKDRDSAERFARASRRGWEWAAEHPDETLEIVMKYVKEYRIPTNRVLQQLMLEEVLRLQLDPDSGKREFRLRPDMVDKAGRLMLEGGLIKKEIKYEQLLP
ncbi:MAG: ABC transporter substrate-binding protein [Bacteroidales bacterium]|nr:ABC transporter substrate-binding protein [Bacteroidales bacterium]